MPFDSPGLRSLKTGLALFLTTVSIASTAGLACGVPISDAEVAATAAAGGGATASLSAPALDVVNPASSFSAASSLPAGEAPRAAVSITPTPLATLSAATTATAVPSGTPIAAASTTSTPAASPTAEGTASATPSPSETPGTPDAQTALRSASPTGTIEPTGTPSPAAAPLTLATGGAGAGLPAAAVAAVNQVRTNSGRTSLTPNATLAEAANRYAQYMAEQNFFSHDGLDGSSPQSRIVIAGYAGSFKGEALAAGQTSAQQAVTTWINSPGHAAILLEPGAVEVGIGHYYLEGSAYGHYWVLVTGVP